MTLRIALALTMAAMGVRAQPPTLPMVLDRAASYVATFERQLTGIAADETYLQSMASRDGTVNSSRPRSAG